MTSPNEVEVRPFAPDDAAAVSALIATTMRESNARDYAPDRLEALIAYFTATKLRALALERDCLVALSDGRIVGTAARDQSDLATFFVDPAYQGRGIGSRMLEQLEARARLAGVVRLRVRASVTGTDFYVRHGYRRAGDAVEGAAGPQIPLIKHLAPAG